MDIKTYLKVHLKNLKNEESFTDIDESTIKWFINSIPHFFEIPIRVKAMTWWHNLPEVNKRLLMVDEFKGRKHETLTGREIEKIYTEDLDIV